MNSKCRRRRDVSWAPLCFFSSVIRRSLLSMARESLASLHRFDFDPPPGVREEQIGPLLS